MMRLYNEGHSLLSVSCQVSAKFGTCTVVGLNGTHVEAKMFTYKVYAYYLQQLSHLDPRRGKCQILHYM